MGTTQTRYWVSIVVKVPINDKIVSSFCVCVFPFYSLCQLGAKFLLFSCHLFDFIIPVKSAKIWWLHLYSRDLVLLKEFSCFCLVLYWRQNNEFPTIWNTYSEKTLKTVIKDEEIYTKKRRNLRLSILKSKEIVSALFYLNIQLPE